MFQTIWLYESELCVNLRCFKEHQLLINMKFLKDLFELDWIGAIITHAGSLDRETHIAAGGRCEVRRNHWWDRWLGKGEQGASHSQGPHTCPLEKTNITFQISI